MKEIIESIIGFTVMFGIPLAIYIYTTGGL
jgi:hypothetical protein